MTQIGKYKVVRRTGETPLGTVYEAFDPVMRRTVSIQVADDEQTLQKGSESLGKLSHPNIRNMIAHEEADGTVYLVMEHVDAQPISEFVVNDRTKPGDVVRLLKMAGAGLDHAHTHGLVHPGLTPGHLLVDKTGVLKVAGFEMCGMQEVPDELTMDLNVESFLETVPYRSPEFLGGEMTDSRSDQFSLALIAFELLTGQKGFGQTSPLGAMGAIVSGTLPDLKLLEGRVPAGVRRVIEKALASEIAYRYTSCPEMLEALDAAVAGRAEATRSATGTGSGSGLSNTQGVERTSSRSSRLTEELARTRKKHSRRLRWIVAAACLAAAGVVGLIMFETRPVPASVTAVAPPPMAAPDNHADQQRADEEIKDMADKIVHETTVKPVEPGPGKTSKAAQAKKPKKSKPGADLDMGEVQVGH